MKLLAPTRRGGPADQRGLWLANLALVALLILFTAVVVLLAPGLAGQLAGPGLLLAGIVISLVPALVWLAFFYRLDHLEPEPTAYVAGVFVLGALAAQAIGIPLVRDVFGLNGWLYANSTTHLLGSILVPGFVQEFLIFACIRFSIFHAVEFDQRTDGIIYAIAAALGFVTVLNLDYVVGRGGVDLGVGAMRVTTAALAHAGIAGVLGYCLGEFKFERKPFWYLPAALLLVSVLNGLFFWLQDTLTVQGFAFNPQYGLALAVCFALVLLGVVLWLVRRANRESIAPTIAAAAAVTHAKGGR